LTVPQLSLDLNELTYGPLLDNLSDIDGVKVLYIDVTVVPSQQSIELFVEKLQRNTGIKEITIDVGSNHFSNIQLRQIEQVGQMNTFHHNVAGLVMQEDVHWAEEVGSVTRGRFDDSGTALYLAARALAFKQFDQFSGRGGGRDRRA